MGNIIVAYNGFKEDIPLRWRLCDGSNGTPDLTDKFVKGATNFNEIGTSQEVDSHSHITDNSPSHTHESTKSGGSHVHDISTSSGRFDTTDGYYNVSSDSHTHDITGTASGHSHEVDAVDQALPKYYVLCYIMGDEGHNFEMPKDGIAMYSGTIEDLPEGWAFCDGSNGTIDLRNRFIKGANSKGGTGGAESHTHTIPTDTHTHTTTSKSFSHTHSVESASQSISFYFNNSYGKSILSAGSAHTHTSEEAGSHTHTVSSANNIIPYYKLSYIQRIT